MKPFPYEKNLQVWLEARMLSDPFSIIQTEFHQDAMEALACIIAMRFNLTEKQAEERIIAYREYEGQTFPFKCEKCGSNLDGSLHCVSVGCACGAIYVQQSDYSYVRDDTDRGYVTREPGKFINAEIITVHPRRQDDRF